MPAPTPAPPAGRADPAAGAGADAAPAAARAPLGDRFRMLHARQRIITSDLTRWVMLQRIAEAACLVVGARAGVLVVHDREGHVEELAQHGADLVGRARTVTGVRRRLTHAPARFVEATVPVGGIAHAQLFLHDSVHGTFDAEDLEMLHALSRSAGSAIEHAMLFHRANSSVRWLHASGEIARAMLADADIDVFTEIVSRAVAAAEADYGHIIIPTRDGQLWVLAAHGLGTADYLGRSFPPDQSELTRAIVAGRSLRNTHVPDLLSDTFRNVHDYGPVMVAPLLDALGTRGSVLLLRRAGRPAFDETDLSQFSTFAAQTALAMQFADARVDTERLRRVETRSHASRELSDIVMQRLFAVGIGLDSLSTELARATYPDSVEHHAKLQRHITDLDDTIEEIRRRVFLDADTLPPPETKFPRLPLAEQPEAPPPGPARNRGRRRSDWSDGTGRQRP